MRYFLLLLILSPFLFPKNAEAVNQFYVCITEERVGDRYCPDNIFHDFLKKCKTATAGSLHLNCLIRGDRIRQKLALRSSRQNFTDSQNDTFFSSLTSLKPIEYASEFFNSSNDTFPIQAIKFCRQNRKRELDKIVNASDATRGVLLKAQYRNYLPAGFFNALEKFLNKLSGLSMSDLSDKSDSLINGRYLVNKQNTIASCKKRNRAACQSLLVYADGACLVKYINSN